jgi:hypothetical protein
VGHEGSGTKEEWCPNDVQDLALVSSGLNWSVIALEHIVLGHFISIVVHTPLVVTLAQMIQIVLFFNVEWPWFLQSLFTTQNLFSSFYDSWLSIDCLFYDGESLSSEPCFCLFLLFPHFLTNSIFKLF